MWSYFGKAVDFLILMQMNCSAFSLFPSLLLCLPLTPFWGVLLGGAAEHTALKYRHATVLDMMQHGRASDCLGLNMGALILRDSL